MAPKKMASIEGDYDISVVLDDERRTIAVTICKDTTVAQLKEKLFVLLRLPPSIVLLLRHSGHRLPDQEKIGLKNPLVMQKATKMVELAQCVDEEEFFMHTQVSLAEYAVERNISVAKTASKAMLVAAIMAGLSVSGSRNSSIVIILNTAGLNGGAAVPITVKAGSVINIMDYVVEPKPNAQARIKPINRQTDKQQTIKQNEPNILLGQV